MAPDQAQLYSLNLEALHAQGRSLEVLLQSRMCPSCRSRAGKGPTPAPGGWEGLLGRIRQCCAREESFITPQTPILEAVFRLLLAKGEPLSLEVLAQEAAQLQGFSHASEERLEEMLEKMLGRNSFYGFQRHPLEINA